MPRATPARLLPRLATLLVLALGACAAHEKAGDRAAATGDWRTAEREYGEAARKDPDKKDLQAKWRDARGAALADAVRRARACAAAQDWECALDDARYGLSLDAGNADLVLLRRDAGRGAGLLRIRRAEDAAARNEPGAALGLLASALEASDDPGVALEARRVQPRLVAGAVAAGDRLLAEGRYEPAIDLFARAAALDAGVRPRLEGARAAYERWKDGEAERLAREGDGLLDARRFADARGAYDQAAHLRPQGRGGLLGRYAGLLARGEDLARKQDWAGAERAFREATALPPERERRLAGPLAAAVQVRPWAVTIGSVLVTPVRPDGYPWSGGRSRGLDLALELLRGADPRGAVPVGVALDVARRIPRENQPELVVQVMLPDGRAVQAGPTRGTLAQVDGSFVVLANAWDERTVTLRVTAGFGPGALEVGAVAFRLGELVTRGELALRDGSIAEARVLATPAALPEGAVTGLRPTPDGSNLATGWSQPGPGAKGFRLRELEARLGAGDLAPGAPPPALSVEIRQRGAVVFASPPQAGGRARWEPPAAFLFVADEEPVVLRLLAQAGRGAPAVLVEKVVTGRDLGWRVNASTPRGTSLELSAEARR